MKILHSWLREFVGGLPPAHAVADALVKAGFEVEAIVAVGRDLAGVVVGRVVEIELVEAKKKNVRFVQVAVAETEGGPATRGIVCGAFNFDVGDLVPVALPGAVLPGGFEISSRKTYGRVSDGMICSARELGIGEDHEGILVLPPDYPVGADVAELLGLADDLFELKVNPDRGYGLSARGLARELATAFGLPFDDPAAAYAAPANLPLAYPVRVEDTEACDRYVARVITNVDAKAATPMFWQRRLSTAGMRPISVAVDVTNAVMLGLGHPLHAFDRSRLSGPIVVRRARAGERLVTLDGVDRALDPEDLLITDDSGPIALAGVMGGAATELNEATTDIVIEAAHFDPIAIARTARRHKLFSEASRRFERGVDPALAPAAAQAAAVMLAEFAGATPQASLTDVDHRPPPVVVTFPLGEPERLAGRPYPEEVVRRRLADVGCVVTDVVPAAVVTKVAPVAPGGVPDASGAKVASVAGADPVVGVDPLAGASRGVVEVTVPSWRPDLARPADLVEEVVRLEGYDTIPVRLPRLPAGAGLTQEQRLRRAVGRALAYDGLTEVLTVPFVAASAVDQLGLPEGDRRRAAVKVANPIAEDAAYLRTTLLPGLIGAALRNIGRGQADLGVFEIGTVFREPAGGVQPVATPPVDRRPSAEAIEALNAVLPEQPRHVAMLLTGRREASGWWGQPRQADWSDAIEAAHAVGRAVGVRLVPAAAETMPWHPGRCAALSAASPASHDGPDGPVLIGHAGELHPRVVAAFGLPPRTVAAELDLDLLLSIATNTPPVVAPTVSMFPPADRDVALVVDVGVPVAQVSEALRAGAGDLLESLTLFDLFEGAQVGDGRRSLAFGMRLRAADRTLTAAEANDARDAAIAEATRLTGAALRS